MRRQLVSAADGRFILETDHLSVELDAAAGGKIRSFISKVTGTNYLYTDPRGRLAHPADYSSHDISGFDECFPTVSSCQYPVGPMSGTPLGDHGLLWQRPWKADQQHQRLLMWQDVPALNAEFHRTCWLEDERTLRLQYRIVNRGREPLEYLYSAHPLLAACQDSRLVLPAEVDRMWVGFVANVEGLAPGDWMDWPPRDRPELCPPFDPCRGSSFKVFTPRLKHGQAAVCVSGCEEQLEIAFDVARLPYLGVLVQQGFDLAEDGPFRREVLLALEPTTGMGDGLPACRANRTIARIPARESVEFWIQLSIT